jgi:hypothetical protein
MLVVGGSQGSKFHSLKTPVGMKKGIICYFDMNSENVKKCVEYISPPVVCADDDPHSILFKASTLVGDKLYVCTTTELLVYSLPHFNIVSYITHPLLNDVHHVKPSLNGNLLVVNSGLDMVLEITHDGEVVRVWNVLGEDPWERFSREVDYRKITSTKPHKSHPNYVFHIGDELWVTRFEQKDAISLHNPSRRIDIGIERPHEGIVHDNKIYFTTVDGQVVINDSASLERLAVYDLNRFNDDGRTLGWCRGLAISEYDTVFVGFSRIRPTKFQKNIQWAKHKMRKKTGSNKPTRVIEYNFKRNKLIREINLEEHGVNVIFSIHL